MMKLKLSLAQFRIQPGNVADNLAIIADDAMRAADEGSQILLLPELCTTGYVLEEAQDNPALSSTEITSAIQKIAQERSLGIGGSWLTKIDGALANTYHLIGPNGDILAQYDKIHPFRPFNEHVWLKSGTHPVIADTPWGRIGCAICYDLRFPELFRAYAQEDVQLVLLGAEWALTRIGNWDILLRARAIENQFFIAAVNTAGPIQDETFGGHSSIIAPTGDIVSAAGDQPAMLTAEIDLADIPASREYLRYLDDVTPDAYKIASSGGYRSA
jgi:predicted amidohydrolase